MINSLADFHARLRDNYAGVGMSEELALMRMEMAEMRRIQDNSKRHGKVTQVDTKKAKARIEVSNKDGESVLSPWVPYQQKGQSGGMSRHEPPFMNQQMSMDAPGGEWRQGTVDALTWSDENKAPSTSNDEHVQAWGDYKRTEAKDFSKHAVGDKAYHAVQKDHTVLAFGKDFVIWTDDKGCWSSKPINQKAYPYKDDSPAGGGSGGGSSGGSGGQ